MASIYLEDTTKKPKEEQKPTILPMMEELVDFCAARGMKLLCGIDCNAHSSLWGSDDINKRGEDLEEFIFNKGLFIHNIGKEPTWEARGLSSIIDITLSLNLGDGLNQWKVHTDTHYSDHNMISYVLDSVQNAKEMFRNYSKAKWPIFYSNVSENLEKPPLLWSEDIIESALQHLYDTIEKGLDQACPKRQVRKKNTIMWWNQDCEDARNHYISLRSKVRRLYRRKLLPPVELIFRMKEAKRTLVYISRKSKRNSFRELVRETNSVSEMAKLDKILDRKEARILGMVKRPDGSSTVTTGETLRVMLSEHFPGS